MNKEKAAAYTHYKSQNPESILFFRISNERYEAYLEDAEKLMNIGGFQKGSPDVVFVPSSDIYDVMWNLCNLGFAVKTIQCLTVGENFIVPDVNESYCY